MLNPPGIASRHSGYVGTVILRPGFGRRISRNECNMHAVSRHFGEDPRESAGMQQTSPIDSGRSFGQNRAQDDRLSLFSRLRSCATSWLSNAATSARIGDRAHAPAYDLRLLPSGEQLPQHKLQNAAVLVIEDLLRGVYAHGSLELFHGAVAP